MIKDFYRLLGLPRGAPLDEIKSAYRRMAAQYHPDKVAGLGPEVQDVAQAKMLELNEAMALLADPAKRAEYDEVLDLIPERPMAPPAPSSSEPLPTGTEPGEPKGGEAAPDADSESSYAMPKRASAAAPVSSVSRDLFLEQQGRELKVGLQGLTMQWRESA
ncbi:MAG TPA: J domain-containing protein, partial [Ramlibacter sp.]